MGDLKDLLAINNSDGNPASDTPPPPQSHIPPELSDSIARLEESVRKTQTQLDDMIATRQISELIAKFEAFKSARKDFDEAAFFGFINQKYDEMIQAGSTPEEAQETTDSVYVRNPAAWVVIADEIQKASAPKTPDISVDDISGDGVANVDDSFLAAPNRANLGKSLTKGTK